MAGKMTLPLWWALASAWVGDASGVPPRTRGVPAPGSILVAGRVVASRTDEWGVTIATVAIDHVFQGNLPAGRTTFAVTAQPLGSLILSLEPPPRVGERGLWLLTRDGEEIIPDVYATLGCTLLKLPARDVDPTGFHAALEWAAAVERNGAAVGDDRLRAMRAMAPHRNPIISTWAIQEIERLNPSDLAGYFAMLVRAEEVSVQARLACDDALCRLSSQWVRDPGRYEVLAGLAKALRSAQDVDRFADHLRLVVRQGALEQNQLVKLVWLALSSKYASSLDRCWYLCIPLGEAARNREGGEGAFEALLELAADPADHIAVAAARELVFATRDAGRIARLRSTAVAIKNDHARRILMKALGPAVLDK